MNSRVPLLDPHSEQGQLVRQRVEQSMRRKHEEQFLEEGEYGIRLALDGLFTRVRSEEQPKIALAAALWCFLIWTRGKNPPAFQEPLRQFLESISERDVLTIAFINGIEFITQTGMPVVDCDKLFVLPTSSVA